MRRRIDYGERMRFIESIYGSKSQAAKSLHCSKSTVSRAIQTGRLSPAIARRVNRRVYYYTIDRPIKAISRVPKSEAIREVYRDVYFDLRRKRNVTIDDISRLIGRAIEKVEKDTGEKPDRIYAQMESKNRVRYGDSYFEAKGFQSMATTDTESFEANPNKNAKDLLRKPKIDLSEMPEDDLEDLGLDEGDSYLGEVVATVPQVMRVSCVIGTK